MRPERRTHDGARVPPAARRGGGRTARPDPGDRRRRPRAPGPRRRGRRALPARRLRHTRPGRAPQPSLPEEYGGGGRPCEVRLQVVEEFSARWAGVGVGLSVHTSVLLRPGRVRHRRTAPELAARHARR
ncbi:acyl-CoA dehydrogenase family protein [Streptomyces sp. AK04-3B]|nr:acyl-CoA dehydrogenase family protein [Streptomyces sp. AK04-3B]MDX3799800.1 acyl-CoA dehydrogenase family protein [Streptomyces sp. AK04-3B]